MKRRPFVIFGGALGLLVAALFLIRGGGASAPVEPPVADEGDGPGLPPGPSSQRRPGRGAVNLAAEGPPAIAEQPDARARSLVARWLALLAPQRPLTDDEKAELEVLEADLLGLGEAAAPALIETLDAEARPGTRDRLFNLLRRVPGHVVEDRLLAEARASAQPSMRTMAIESLGGRKTDRAMAALAEIARSDPEIPNKPLIAGPRDPSDTSTELPDETTFTPRMQAMAVLAATGDPRAAAVLAEVARAGPDESLRMEAARHLGGLRADPRAAEALRAAAASDPSAYVRLSALHSLNGSTTDAQLVATLERIIARDPDAGVRTLAGRVLADLRR